MSVHVLYGKDSVIRDFYVRELIGDRDALRVAPGEVGSNVGGASLFGDAPILVVSVENKKGFDTALDAIEGGGGGASQEVVFSSKTKPSVTVSRRLNQIGAQVEEATVSGIVKKFVPHAPAGLVSALNEYAGDDPSILVSFVENFRHVKQLDNLTLQGALSRLSHAPGVVPYWHVTNKLGGSVEDMVESYRRYVSGSPGKEPLFLRFLFNELRLIMFIGLLSDCKEREAMNTVGVTNEWRFRKLKKLSKRADIMRLSSTVKEVSRFCSGADNRLYVRPEFLRTLTEKLLVDVSRCFG